MKADLMSVQLSSCHPGRMTSASIPSLWGGDRFSERAVGGLCREEFRKGKMEGSGISMRVLGSKEGPALKEKGRVKRIGSLRERTEVTKQGKEE